MPDFDELDNKQLRERIEHIAYEANTHIQNLNRKVLHLTSENNDFRRYLGDEKRRRLYLQQQINNQQQQINNIEKSLQGR